MDIPIEAVRDIHAITEAMIEAMEEQIARRGITEGNVPIDAAVNCLCYALTNSGAIDDPEFDQELLRRIAKYREAMKLDGAPGGKLA